MATRTTELVTRVVAEVADATAGLDAVGSAGAAAAAGVDKAAAAASAAGGKLDAVAGSADNLDSKMGAATGALGALSSGFELVGLEQYAAGLQSAGLATDFLSGVGQSLTLVMESTKIQTALAKGQTIAHAAASKGSAAATAVLTGAQKALNVAMRANPVGLIITALTLLVGGLVVAYNKSDSFRAIVNRVGEAGRDAFSLVGEWVGKAVDVVKDIATAAGNVPEKFTAMKDKAVEIGAALLSPFTAVKDAIDNIIELIGKIKIPDIDVPFVGRVSTSAGGLDYSLPLPGGGFGRTAASSAAAAPAVLIQVSGALDPAAVAVQIRDLLARYDVAVGF